MFNQFVPSFAGQYSGQFPGSNASAFGFHSNGFNNFGFNGFQPNAWNANSPFSWNGQNPTSSNNTFDWNAFYAGCSFGFQNACGWFNTQGQATDAGNTATSNVPAGFNPGNFNNVPSFGFFPYGPFPFNFYNQQNGMNTPAQNQQAA